MVNTLESGLSGLQCPGRGYIHELEILLSQWLTYFDFPAKTKTKNSWLIKVQNTKAFEVIIPAMYCKFYLYPSWKTI